MNSVRLLDCTLRDGGYYNSWDFSRELVQDYFSAMRSIGVSYVEVGLRTIQVQKGFKGACAYSTESYLESLSIPDGIEIGVMVNASELLSGGDIYEVLDKMFVAACESHVKLVRIACHVDEFEDSLLAGAWLKEQGYLVGFNLMQISGQSSEKVESLAHMANEQCIDVLYFADSLGSMTPEETRTIVKTLRKGWKGDLGIHTHDNMGRAVQNTIAAIESGVSWVDSTVTGMGRGAGNAQTEYLILALKMCSVRTTGSLLGLIEKYFKPLKDKYGWGANPFYFLAAEYEIHPSFVQEMLSDNRYSVEDILVALDHLKSIGGKKFNAAALEELKYTYQGAADGDWSPGSIIDGRDVLILGNGEGVKKHKDAIERYIEKYSPVVIALNTQDEIDGKLINARAACHPIRLLADCEEYVNFSQPLIAPLNTLEEDLRETLGRTEVLNFGMVVKPNTFKLYKKYAEVPGSLVVAYALAIASSGNARAVYLAGFDGYGVGDSRNAEVGEVFELYKENVDSPLISLTPTQYDVDCVSVYSF